ncbi:MAG: hypothetical protein A2096_03985 [Spirochaetes bacterium GWF1_41_5]|nr:MAG: hypothetical protein A2096_03985 [Spirochaetes bacterium GWF1_41_5]HBE04290.1 hypothetical protein [Spirochaetia bacterium]
MKKEKIGCCGAYCGTCPALKKGLCKGCKTGFITGERNLSKARCKIKICCIQNGFNTCADCSLFTSCGIIQNFYIKKGYKYKKYKNAIEFIRASGYDKFLKNTVHWKIQYGKII